MKRLLLLILGFCLNSAIYPMQAAYKEQFSYLNPLRLFPSWIQEKFYPELKLNEPERAIRSGNLEFYQSSRINTSMIDPEQKDGTVSKEIKEHLLKIADNRLDEITLATDRVQRAQDENNLVINWSITGLLTSATLFSAQKVLLNIVVPFAEKHTVGSLLQDKADLQPLSDFADTLKKGAFALASLGAIALCYKYLHDSLKLHQLSIDQNNAIAIRRIISRYRTDIKAEQTAQVPVRSVSSAPGVLQTPTSN